MISTLIDHDTEVLILQGAAFVDIWLAEIRGRLDDALMALENSPATTTSIGASPVFPWSDQTLFQIVGDSFRCRIVGSLAAGKAKNAADLNAGSGRKRHAYLKHLTMMCKAGLLVQTDNPKDRRRPLYALHRAIVVRRTEDMTSVDLGGCVLRFPLR